MPLILIAQWIFRLLHDNISKLVLITIYGLHCFIIDNNQLDINLIKVKAHDTNPYNNEVDRLACESHTSDYTVKIIDYFNPCLSYTPLWNGIKIEKHLRHFITDVSWN